ncbi:MAG: hypothetical protein RLZZ543_2273 [Bacteroidota bacterium]
MKKLLILPAVLLLLLLIQPGCKNHQAKSSAKATPFRVMFYNVENLYDAEDDPNIDDQEFLPGSESKWTKERFETKLQHIAQVIHAVGDQELLPDMIGLGEVENHSVLDQLLTKTDLSKLGYSIVHFDSPDKRGIDVALLYRSNRVKILKATKQAIVFPGDMDKPTRDILYVKGELPNKAQLHVLVNHWPSRSGGQKETEPKRIMAAQTAKRLCDSIAFNDRNANILLMGDLNDYPSDKSLTEALGAQNDTSNTSSALFNLMGWQKGENVGSHPYKGEWGFLDQIIVSGSIIKGDNHLKTYFNQAKAFRADFLIEKNEKFNNWQTKRTYGGKNYLGGYSDHLPVFVNLYMGK